MECVLKHGECMATEFDVQPGVNILDTYRSTEERDIGEILRFMIKIWWKENLIVYAAEIVRIVEYYEPKYVL